MAISQRSTVIGIFNEQDNAKKAMEELLQAEFTIYWTRDCWWCIDRGTWRRGAWRSSGRFYWCIRQYRSARGASSSICTGVQSWSRHCNSQDR